MICLRTKTVLLSAALLATGLWDRGSAQAIPPAVVASAPSAPAAAARSSSRQAEPPPSAEEEALQAEALRLLTEASAFINAGDFQRAEPLLRQAEPLMRKTGVFDAKMEQSMRLGFAMAAMQAQRGDVAEREFLGAREAILRAEGRDSKELANTDTYLAMLMIARGDLDAARPYLDEAYPIYRKLNDPNHDLARSNLMYLLAHETKHNRADSAVRYGRELCELWQRAEKPDDPDHIDALEHMALAQYSASDYPGALGNFDAAIALSARLKGPDHEETKELRDLAEGTAKKFMRTEAFRNLMVETKQLAESLDQHSKDPAVLRSNVEKIHRLIAATRLIDRLMEQPSEKADRLVFVLGYMHDQLDEVPEAMKRYREFVDASDQVSPRIDVEKSLALVRLARLELNHTGDAAQARAHALRVAEHFAADPAEAKREWLARKYLVYIECTRGDPSAGLDHLDRYAQLMREIRRDRLPEEILFRAQFAYVCGADPQLRDRSRAMLDEACKTSAETFGPRSTELGAALQWLAMFQYRAGEATCADTLMNADRLLIPTEGEHDVGASYRRMRIAKYLRAHGRLDDARGLYEAELKRLHAHAPTDANRTAIALGYLAGIDAHQGRREQADRRYHEAVDAVAHQNDPVAQELTEFFGKQSVDLAAGQLPSLAPADNADSGPTRFAIP